MPLFELEGVATIELAPGVNASVVHTGNISVAHVRFRAGAAIPEHLHHHEQVVNVTDGELELTVDDNTVTLTPGRVYVIPPMAQHAARAVRDTKVVDIFHPVREDFSISA